MSEEAYLDYLDTDEGTMFMVRFPSQDVILGVLPHTQYRDIELVKEYIVQLQKDIEI